jgi:hypothetical protein
MSASSLLEPPRNLRSFRCDTTRSHSPDDHSQRASRQDRERRPVCPGRRTRADGIRTLSSARRNQLAAIRPRSSASRETHSGSAYRDRRLLLQLGLRRLRRNGSASAGARSCERPTLRRRQERMARRRTAARARRETLRAEPGEAEALAAELELQRPPTAWQGLRNERPQPRRFRARIQKALRDESDEIIELCGGELDSAGDQRVERIQ